MLHFILKHALAIEKKHNGFKTKSIALLIVFAYLFTYAIIVIIVARFIKLLLDKYVNMLIPHEFRSNNSISYKTLRGFERTNFRFLYKIGAPGGENLAHVQPYQAKHIQSARRIKGGGDPNLPKSRRCFYFLRECE